MFAVKLANFLMFTVSKEITVKCLECSSDIFGNGRTSSLVFGNLRKSSVMVDSLRKSFELIRNKREQENRAQRRSKNNLRGITMGIGPIWGFNSLSPFILSCAELS